MAIGDFSHLVTNALMKKVLSDVAHLNSAKLGKNYTLTKKSRTACTSGPATWYGRAGIHLTFWNGALPFTPANKYYLKGKRSATVLDMKSSLTKAGFQIVWSGTGQDANTKLGSLGILRPGDVATMLSSDSAHAAMWTGEDWRSDFLQGNKPYPYSSVGRGGNETFILWRYLPFQDNLSLITNTSTTSNVPINNTNMASKANKKPKRINNFGGYPAWGKMYSDAQKLMSDYKVDTNIVRLIILACIANGLSLNQTAVILGNAFLESHFKLKAKNNIKGGHHGIWQFSSRQYNLFGLQDWNKLLKYLMEEVAKTPDESVYVNKKGKRLNWYAPHKNGNGWRIRHKKVWDRSDNIELLSWAFGEGWERYGNAKADTDSRTQLSKLFRDYLINSNYTFNGSLPTNNLYIESNYALKEVSNNQLKNTLQDNNYSNSYSYEDDLFKSMDKTIQTLNLNNETNTLTKDYFADLNNLYNNNNYTDFDYSFLDNLYSDNTSSDYSDERYIDYYSPFLNYLNLGEITLFLSGGTVRNNLDDLNIQQSKYVRPVGPIKPISGALDYKKIINILLNKKGTSNNLIEKTYSELYLNGSKIRMGHPEDSNYEDDIYYVPPKSKKTEEQNKQLGNTLLQPLAKNSPSVVYEDDIYYNAPNTKTTPKPNTSTNVTTSTNTKSKVGTILEDEIYTNDDSNSPKKPKIIIKKLLPSEPTYDYDDVYSKETLPTNKLSTLVNTTTSNVQTASNVQTSNNVTKPTEEPKEEPKEESSTVLGTINDDEEQHKFTVMPTDCEDVDTILGTNLSNILLKDGHIDISSLSLDEINILDNFSLYLKLNNDGQQYFDDKLLLLILDYTDNVSEHPKTFFQYFLNNKELYPILNDAYQSKFNNYNPANAILTVEGILKNKDKFALIGNDQEIATELENFRNNYNLSLSTNLPKEDEDSETLLEKDTISDVDDIPTNEERIKANRSDNNSSMKDYIISDTAKVDIHPVDNVTINTNDSSKTDTPQTHYIDDIRSLVNWAKDIVNRYENVNNTQSALNKQLEESAPLGVLNTDETNNPTLYINNKATSNIIDRPARYKTAEENIDNKSTLTTGTQETLTVQPSNLDNTNIIEKTDKEVNLNTDNTEDNDKLAYHYYDVSGVRRANGEVMKSGKNYVKDLKSKVHTVTKGEDFIDIADKYGVAYDDLMEANGLSGPGATTVRPGQTLKIPDKNTTNTTLLEQVSSIKGVDPRLSRINIPLTPNVTIKPVASVNIPKSTIRDTDDDFDINGNIENDVKNSVNTLQNKDYNLVPVEIDAVEYPRLELSPGLMASYSTKALDDLYGSNLKSTQLLTDLRNGNLDNIDNYDMFMLDKLYDVYSDKSIHPRLFDGTLLNLIKAYGKIINNDKRPSFYNDYIKMRDSNDYNELYLSAILDEYRYELVHKYGYDPFMAAIMVADIPFNRAPFRSFMELVDMDKGQRTKIYNIFEKLTDKYTNTYDFLFNDDNKNKKEDYLPPESSNKSWLEMHSSELAGNWKYYKNILNLAFNNSNLPEIFKFIPLMYNVNANYQDTSGKSGFWGLPLYEAKNLGLEVTSLVDERRDPIKSTQATVKYLTLLYNNYKDPLLALLSFATSDKMIVDRATARFFRDHPNYDVNKPLTYNQLLPYIKDVRLKASIQKLVKIANNSSSLYAPAKKSTYSGDVVDVNNRINLNLIANVLNIPLKTLRALNPLYRQDIIPGNIKTYKLILPPGTGLLFKDNLDNILNYDKDFYSIRELAEPGVHEDAKYKGRKDESYTYLGEVYPESVKYKNNSSTKQTTKKTTRRKRS